VTLRRLGSLTPRTACWSTDEVSRNLCSAGLLVPEHQQTHTVEVQRLVQQAERVDRVVHVVDAAEVRTYGQAEECT
jgi:hypothetical protein